MGVISRRVLPACGSLCFFCPALRARSRQPVKRYKKLLADIFPRSQVGLMFCSPFLFLLHVVVMDINSANLVMLIVLTLLFLSNLELTWPSHSQIVALGNKISILLATSRHNVSTTQMNSSISNK